MAMFLYRFLLVVLIGIITTACVTTVNETKETRMATQTQPKCLSESEISEGLKWVDSFLVRTGLRGKDKPKLIEGSKCWKRKYTFGDSVALIYNEPGKVDTLYRVSSSKKLAKFTDACEKDARDFLTAIGYQSGLQIVKQSKITNAWEWSDEDIRPMQWLACDKQGSPKFNLSVAIYVHELLHGLRTKVCIFNSRGGSNYCFDQIEGLPLRRTVKFRKLPKELVKHRFSVEFFEKLYMADVDTSTVVGLFDELNAYIATTDVLSLMLATHGKKSFGGSQV